MSKVIPENIRNNLKKYPDHTHLTCLECGYVGLGGCLKISKPLIYRLSIYGAGVFIYFVVYFYGYVTSFWQNLVFGAFVALLARSTKFFVCPNCGIQFK